MRSGELREQPTVVQSAYPSKSNVEGGKPVTTLQAILLGMMLSWTPSLVVLAFLLWKDELVYDEGAG